MVLLAALVASALAQGQTRCGQTPVPPDLTPTTDVDRIVGGRVAVAYSWPWQIVWCTTGWFGGCDLECGGSVIAEGWVVTAGHCVYGDEDSPGQFNVKAGVFDESSSCVFFLWSVASRSSTEDGEVTLKVKQIHLHPQYVPDPVPLWDISLIELADKITFTDHIQPVCFALYDNTTAIEPNNAWVTGWGTTSGSFHEVKVKEICRERQHQQEAPPGAGSFRERRHLRLGVRRRLCPRRSRVRWPTGQGLLPGVASLVSKFKGDSGGPLVVATNNTWFLYGLTSWGEGCAEKGYAGRFQIRRKCVSGVYSRTIAYCDWIASETNGDVTCKDQNTY